jgi:hypothetical protein
MKSEIKHADFCSAGQPAPVQGCFPNDVLPCVCGVEGDAVTALAQVAVPTPVGGTPPPPPAESSARRGSKSQGHKPARSKRPQKGETS